MLLFYSLYILWKKHFAKSQLVKYCRSLNIFFNNKLSNQDVFYNGNNVDKLVCWVNPQKNKFCNLTTFSAKCNVHASISLIMKYTWNPNSSCWLTISSVKVKDLPWVRNAANLIKKIVDLHRHIQLMWGVQTCSWFKILITQQFWIFRVSIITNI